MAPTLDVATDEDRPRLASLLAHAFAFPIADTDVWYARAGRDNVLAYRDGARLVGGLITVPMGQFFGGRSVRMMGLAGVGVGPEHRGSGAGAAMVTDALRLARRRGAMLSALYPSTVPFYQAVGYERAGARFKLTVDPRELAGLGRGLPPDVHVEPVALDPDDELRALQRRIAATRDGALDRGDYIWQRTTHPWRSEPVAFGVRRAGRLVGHVVLSHRTRDGHDTVVDVADLTAEDAVAARAALGLLGGYRSLANVATMNVHVPGVVQGLLPDRRASLTVGDFWMLRVLDVDGALSERGYRRSVRGTVDLAVEDPVLPECGGSFRLRVDDGRAAVTRGGSGAVRLGPRGLAALYSGLAGGRELSRLGLAKGPDDALALLDDLFAGPMPTMTEMF